LVSPAQAEDDVAEAGLRPRRLDDYIGQDRVRENLQVSIEAAVQRGEGPGSPARAGHRGWSKTTLAYVIANELGVPIRTTSGPVIEAVTWRAPVESPATGSAVHRRDSPDVAGD
jgi:Holliday junction DNA helicase RuvB